jgi:hypothetical protein
MLITLIAKMDNLPFHLSPQAKAWLSSLPEKADEELGFVCFPRYGMSRGSEILEAFDREHYAFVHAPAAVWSDDRSGFRIAVDGKPFWLTPEILHGLEGKKLEVIRVNVGQGKYAGRFREFLVASLVF